METKQSKLKRNLGLISCFYCILSWQHLLEQRSSLNIALHGFYRASSSKIVWEEVEPCENMKGQRFQSGNTSSEPAPTNLVAEIGKNGWNMTASKQRSRFENGSSSDNLCASTSGNQPWFCFPCPDRKFVIAGHWIFKDVVLV